MVHKACENCSHKDRCSEVYHSLGSYNGPSVLRKVIVAFLMPIIIFIIVGVTSQNILEKHVESEKITTAISFFNAVIAVFFYLLVIKITTVIFKKTRTS